MRSSHGVIRDRRLIPAGRHIGLAVQAELHEPTPNDAEEPLVVEETVGHKVVEPIGCLRGLAAYDLDAEGTGAGFEGRLEPFGRLLVEVFRVHEGLEIWAVRRDGARLLQQRNNSRMTGAVRQRQGCRSQP